MAEIDKPTEITKTIEQHVFHHNETTPQFTFKIEKNSKGFNYEVSVSGVDSIDEGINLLSLSIGRLGTLIQSITLMGAVPPVTEEKIT